MAQGPTRPLVCDDCGAKLDVPDVAFLMYWHIPDGTHVVAAYPDARDEE